MRRSSFRLLALGLVLALLLSVPALGVTTGEAEVTASVLNFRDGPSTTAKVIGQVTRGTVVTVLEVLDGWCKVEWEGKTGYMSADYLVSLEPAEPVEPTEAEETAEAPDPSPAPSEEPEPSPGPETAPEPSPEAQEEGIGMGTLTGDCVRLRTGPSLEDSVTRYLYRGDRVKVLEQVGEWYRVTVEGKPGYVFGRYVALDADRPAVSDTVTAVLDLAREQLGISYVYGGASPGTGFDCSGLVYYCFTQNGFSMNRTASGQYRQGAGVEKADLEPGDLVFFASSGGWYIGHVGIYLGDGEFIHASSGGRRIMINKLSDSYWNKYYYGARRIIGVE